jgi:hypothetical protein
MHTFLLTVLFVVASIWTPLKPRDCVVYVDERDPETVRSICLLDADLIDGDSPHTVGRLAKYVGYPVIGEEIDIIEMDTSGLNASVMETVEWPQWLLVSGGDTGPQLNVLSYYKTIVELTTLPAAPASDFKVFLPIVTTK